MDTSVTLIGLAITALIAVPLYMAMRSNQVSKKRIKAILAQHPTFQFTQLETQNKRTYALDEQQKGFLLIDFNPVPEKVSFVNLADIGACKLVPTTSAGDTTKIELEFLHRNLSRQMVAVYEIEYDQITQVCLHEDQELAKRWQQKIILTLTK